MKNYLTIGLSLAVLIFAYIIYDQSVDSKIKDHDSHMKIKALEKEAGTYRAKYDSLYSHDEAILLQYGLSVQRANIMEQRALKAENQLSNEIRRNRHFSDAVTDSLVANIR